MMKLQVTGVLFSELIPVAMISSFDFTLMELTPQPDNLQPSSLLFFPVDYDGLLRWPFPKVVHLNLRDRLDPLNAWTQTIQPTRESRFRRPTSSLKNDAFAVALYKYIPHSKVFCETDGYIVKDTCYIEISFSDPIVQKPSIQKLPFLPFP